MSTMQRVSTLVSADIGNYLTNKKTWNGILYNVKSYGAKGNGTTDDTVNIQKTIDAAYTDGVPVEWPAGTYLTTESIEHFHDVRHMGEGIIKRGTSLFHITPLPGQANSIFVDTDGNDTNDGLDTVNPKGTIQDSVDTWAKYAINTQGDWKIDIAAGTYTEGAVIDSIISATELVIEGKLSSGSPSVIIDGTSATEDNGLNFNGGVLARVKNIKVQDFTLYGVVFQNGSNGTIDTCDSFNNGFVGFGANQASNLVIIGDCSISVPTGAKGIRYYRQCTGSWSDGDTTIDLDGGGNICDGIEIRDNSYVVAENGITVNNFQNNGVYIRRHSYMELRDSTISNNATGIAVDDLALYANATGVVTLTGNTANFRYGGFSLPFDTPGSMVIGATGPSVQGVSSNYDLIVSSLGATGLQFLTDSASSAINIDFNKLGRMAYVLSDNSLRFWLNAAEVYRMRTDALIPLADNTKNLGVASNRWGTVYAGTGTINTSDRNEKQQIGAIPDEVLNAWAEVNYTQFKFNDAVEQKGDSARWHFGLIAQEIKETFERHGLDATKYGILCYDEWDDVYETTEENEKILDQAAGSRWGIRADECQFLEMALMRRELQKIKSTL